MASIETVDLTKNYGELCAVDGLNLEVKNEIFGLLGPNGSGKTTTVLMLTTLISQTRGSASVCGYDTLKHPDKVKRLPELCPAGYGNRHEPHRQGEYDDICPPLRN